MLGKGVHLELVQIDQVVRLASPELLHQDLVIACRNLLPGDVQSSSLFHRLFEKLVFRIILSACYCCKHLNLSLGLRLGLGKQGRARYKQGKSQHT